MELFDDDLVNFWYLKIQQEECCKLDCFQQRCINNVDQNETPVEMQNLPPSKTAKPSETDKIFSDSKSKNFLFFALVLQNKIGILKVLIEKFKEVCIFIS